MKKILFLLTLIFSFISISANLNFERLNENVVINFKNDNILESKEEITEIIALPSRDVEIYVNNCEVSDFSEEGVFLGKRTINGNSKVEVVSSFVMRELYAHRIKINVSKLDRGIRSTINDLNFTITPKDEVPAPQKISSAFLPVYSSMVSNFNESYLRDAEVVPSKMLIIVPTPLVGILEPFTEWKNAKGISTIVASLDETGSTLLEIKSYIQDIYDNSEIPPDYLLIIGDVTGFYSVPSYFYGPEQNVSDHYYTLLEGEDFFPEMLVGRFTIDTQSELQIIISKILWYEKTPYMDNTDWFQNALLVAGNFATTLPIPITPKKVTRWLKDKMLDYGYNQITEVYYPPTTDGSTEINNAINNGVGFVSYRGWGDANGWHFPSYHIEDIDDLNNGYMLPVVTSIVCNTADFANSVDPCFGEVMLSTHIGSIPRGAVGLVGPSDLHTSTRYNNAIFAGFYCGVLDEDILTFGAAVLRGKQELYDNFPLNLEPGDYVEFYFYVYNILGDPSLSMWTKVPQEIVCNPALPDQISMGTTYLDISIPGFGSGIATVMKDDEFYDVAMIEDGCATLYFCAETEGEFEVTITKPNYHPYIKTIEIIQEDIDVGLYEYELSGDVLAGETLDLTVTLKNYGSNTANAVTADLSSNNPYVNITSGNADFGDISAGNTSTQNYQFEILPTCPDNEVLEFILDFYTFGDAKFEFVANSLVFEVTDFVVNDENEILDPGEEREITVTIQNVGSINAVGLHATVESLSDAAEASEDIIEFGNVNVNETAQADFSASVHADCFVGRTVSFRLDLVDDNGLEAQTVFSLEVGEVDNTHPTISESMKYFAYDSFDISYINEVPTYNWIEIDPDEGGEGEVMLMPDDASESIDLPFDFVYYDTVCDSITICTNGWISFRTTWMTNFRNWNIPAALGPYGMVAAYWDDLIGEEYMISDSVYHHDMRICHYYDQTENIFIIEWNECYNRCDPESPEKFEIIIYDPVHYPTIDGNGEIQFNYHTINNPDAESNYTTVGIENMTQTEGVLYTYANIYPASATELENNLAIKFTTDPPDSFTEADEVTSIPSNVVLGKNYPNPFNPSGAGSGRSPVTNISYSIPQDSDVKLEMFNIKGQLVKVLVDNFLGKGFYTVTWDGSDLSNNQVTSGIYFYRLKVDNNFSEIKKCLLLK